MAMAQNYKTYSLQAQRHVNPTNGVVQRVIWPVLPTILTLVLPMSQATVKGRLIKSQASFLSGTSEVGARRNYDCPLLTKKNAW